MGIIIGANFNLSSKKFLDDRQQCESLELLQLNENNLLYPLGFEVYCKKEKCWYQNLADTESDSPNWVKRTASVSSIGGGVEIDDENFSEDTVYSSYKTETLIEGVENSIAQTEDDIDNIDYRLTETELDVLRLQSEMRGTSVNLNPEYDKLQLTSDNLQKCVLDVDTMISMPTKITTPTIKVMVFIKNHPIKLTFKDGSNIQDIMTVNGIDMYCFTFTYVQGDGIWLGKYETYSIND